MNYKKELKMIYEIYKITNKLNGKYYIGFHKRRDKEKLYDYMGSGKLVSGNKGKVAYHNLSLNKNKFFTLIEYEPSLEKQKTKDNIYFSIDEINDDKEDVILNLYSTFEIEFKKDFECFFIEG